MRSIHDVIVRPVITEKSSDQVERQGAYTFVVARDANKHQIAEAVSELFEVDVADVRTMRYRGKAKRVGRHAGRRPAWKKAVVTLREGETIDIYDGV